MRRFVDWFSKRPRASARLFAVSTAEREPTSGLVVVTVIVEAPSPLQATLTLQVNGAPGFAKRLELTPQPDEFRLTLHGHLLPNGPADVRLELRTVDGDLLAARALRLQVRNRGAVAEQVRASLMAADAPLVFEGACDSCAYDYADPRLVPWFDREDEMAAAHLASLHARGEATAEEVDALAHFAREGFLIVPGAIEPGLVAEVNAAIDDAVARKVEGYAWGSSQRIHNLHLQYDAVRRLWLHPRILRMLSLIFGVPARPCQSLTYVFGSQQEHHQDTIHLTPFPAGRMCGVWTALEDVQEGSGELAVFPGSHRLPRIYMDTVGLPKVTGDDWSSFQAHVVARWTQMIDGAGLTREPYRPKAGTVLIWHENLMHAGLPREDLAKSRRSMVGHYFAEGAVVYFDSSGLPGAVYEGELPMMETP